MRGEICEKGGIRAVSAIRRLALVRCDGWFFFTSVNIEGTDDGMAGDGAGVWGCGGG